MKTILSKLTATQIIIYGFLITILVGTFFLALPISSANRQMTNIIDCLFTSTSAVCITGLAVVNTAEHWSTFGQWVILFLIQIGGLGFMSLVTMIFIAMGKKITMRERTVIQEALNLNQHSGLVNFARYIFKFTITVELVGAVILSLRFIPEYDFFGGIYRGIFHSVSAFCNAGFDILGDSSLELYSADFIINFTIMALIVIGGLGFPVIQDLMEMYRNYFIKKFSFRFALDRLKFHSKIVITATFFLILGGFILIFLFEHNNPHTMSDMNIFHKLMASLFQSVTLRTAGFATVNQGNLTYSSKLIGCVLMFIGGSPAGTAGGAKTVTVSILFISVLSLVHGDDEITAFKRTIVVDVLQKALSVVIMMISVIIVATIILSFTDAKILIANGGNYELLDIIYEVVSAIGTVGLSTGLTPILSHIGKIVLVVCMYIGRVGPISLAIALTNKKINNKNNIHYPDGKIIVG